MKIGRDGDVGVVGVRHDPPAGAVQHPREPQRLGEAAEVGEIGLRDVEAVGREEWLKLPAGGEAQIADADGNACRGA